MRADGATNSFSARKKASRANGLGAGSPLRMSRRTIEPGSPAAAIIEEEERLLGEVVARVGAFGEPGGVPIVDWRNAPISKIYYRYEEGDDYDETEGESRLEGLVTMRRNVSIAAGRLRRIGSPQGTFVRDARGVWHEAEGQIRP